MSYGRFGKYSYSDASHSSHGLMRCAACGRTIEAGQYRIREKTEGFVTWHRSCTEADPNWSVLDQQARDRAIRHKAFVQACIAFRDKWGVNDLDEYIEMEGANV